MRVIQRLRGDCLTPVSAFLRVEGKNKCLLESIPREEDSGRYSIIAYDPVFELIFHDEQFSIVDKRTDDRTTYPCKDPLKEIEKYVLKKRETVSDLPFQSGAIGYVGYDIAACYEDIGPLPADELEVPDIDFLIFESFIVLDHQKELVTIVMENTYSDCTEEKLNQKMTTVIEQLKKPSAQEQQPLIRQSLTFSSNLTQVAFEKIVLQAKALITAGDIFQVVPSQRLKASFKQNSFDYYRKLRLANPSAYLYYLDFAPDFKVIGSSPESLVRVKGERVTTNPIAGTRKRGKDKSEDDQLAHELLNDPKERAEHLMLIDLGRNDIGRIAEIGTVSVPLNMVIEKYRYVMHIVSVVQGKRKKDVTAMDALRATLPAGTVSGAPKIRAMTRIYQWEKVKRGVYAGAVGYLSQDDQADFAIGIRTMVVKSGFAYVQAGAGIVYDSDPTAEYFETLQKAKALLEVDSDDFDY